MSAAVETIQLPRQLYIRLWRFAEQEQTEPVALIEHWLERALVQEDDDATTNTAAGVAPIYRLHEYAEDLGVTDLAQNVDHYLYGHEKQ
ncbi:MAG: hypothetical protein DYG89_22200 [Caldilinea sp. CFX5]|nr:hypothetical protein [Caldilinea sp. CFX5]